MFVVKETGLALPPDAPFVLGDVQYPANWLRLASPEARAELGIEEVADPQPYDQRFYWGHDQDGGLIPKDLVELKAQWAADARAAAGSLLSATDWMVIREADGGDPVPEAVRAHRREVREACSAKVAAVEAAASAEELAAYVTSGEYAAWPALTQTGE